jgi:hypothetical protein
MGIAGFGPIIVPFTAAGVQVVAVKGRDIFTLVAGTTYYYIFGGATAPFQHVQLTGYTAGLIITTATIQTCSRSDLAVAHLSQVAGEWINETPADGDVQVDGAGWTASTAIVNVAGGAVGGASWHLRGWGPLRTRLEVVVGATGGDVAGSWSGKE